MNTSIKVLESNQVYIQANAAKKELNSLINSILAKYNSAWFGDESMVDYSKMSQVDVDTYQSVFDARERVKSVIRLLMAK